MKTKPGMILGVQYLRGFAALSVVWFHALRSSPDILQRIGDAYFNSAGVDLFFVISGFIMVATTANKSVTVGRFLESRIIRVIPLYWFWTLALVGIAAVTGHLLKHVHPTGLMVVKSLLFIPYNSPDFNDEISPVLVQGWTLNYEMFFYLLFALSLGLGRFKLEILTGLLVALAAVGYLTGPIGETPLKVYTSELFLEFAAGMWIARFWLKGYRVPLWASIIIVPVGLWLLGVQHWPCVGVGAALTVIGCLTITANVWALLALGDASYSIYLIHPFILSAVAMGWSRVFHFQSVASDVLFVAAGCVASAVGGWICHRMLERPLTRALQFRFKKVNTLPQGAVSQESGVSSASILKAAV